MKVQCLIDQMDELQPFLKEFNQKNQAVSKWSVGEHLEHLMISHRSICHEILKSYRLPPRIGKKKTWMGWFVLTFGWIPRGQGKAPQFAHPTGRDLEEVSKMMDDYIEKLYLMKEKKEKLLASRYSFEHFAFGLFNIHDWLKLMEVHTNHHVKIMRDIC